MKQFIVALFFLISVYFSIFATQAPGSVYSLKFLENDTKTGATQKNKSNVSNIEKAIRVIEIIHASIGAVSYAGFIADSAVGTALGVFAVQDPGYPNAGYRTDLTRWHRGLMLTSYISYGLSAILSYIALGIKIYRKIPVNLPHFIASIVTSVLYLAGMGSMIVAYQAFVPGSPGYASLNPYAKQIGWSHGAIFYALTLSFTVTLIMLPAGSKHKVAFGVK